MALSVGGFAMDVVYKDIMRSAFADADSGGHREPRMLMEFAQVGCPGRLESLIADDCDWRRTVTCLYVRCASAGHDDRVHCRGIRGR